MSGVVFSFKSEGEKLYEVFKRVFEVIDRKATIEVLKTFRVGLKGNVFEVYGTDLVRSYKEQISVDDANGEGEVCIPLEVLNALKVLDEKIEVSVNEGKFFVKSIDTIYEFPVAGVEDYPFLKTEGEFLSFILEKKEFVKILKKLEPFLAEQEAYFVLGGILFEFRENGKLICVSSNAHILGKLESFYYEGALGSALDEEEVKTLILPYTSVKVLKRNLDEADIERVVLELSKNGSLFVVRGENFEYVGRVIKGSYPDWRAVFPMEFSGKAKVNVEEFEKAFKKVEALSKNDKFSPIRFTFANVDDLFSEVKSKLSLTNMGVEEKGKVKVEVPCHYEGQNTFEVSLNAEYVRSFLKVFEGEELMVNFIDERAPLLFEGEENFVFLIMPMMV